MENSVVNSKERRRKQLSSHVLTGEVMWECGSVTQVSFLEQKVVGRSQSEGKPFKRTGTSGKKIIQRVARGKLDNQ